MDRPANPEDEMKRPKVTYKDQHRVGVWQDGPHKRFRIPFIARGALGGAGHVKALGIEVNWHDGFPHGWAHKRAVCFWGLVAIIHHDTKGGTLKTSDPRWRVRWLSISRPRIYRASPY